MTDRRRGGMEGLIHGVGVLVAFGWAGGCWAQGASAVLPQAPAAAASAGASAPAAPLTLRWQRAARSAGRLTAADLGLVINQADPYSVAVGEYYLRRRGLAAEQVLRVHLPSRGRLTGEEFEALQARIGRHFGRRTQALALAWTRPYAVECQSVTGALALGFDPKLCAQTCGKDSRSPYFNASSSRPFTDFGWRPSMLLAASSVEQAQAMIDRGVASDATLGLRGGTPVHAHFMVGRDSARNVRVLEFPPPSLLRPQMVQVHVEAGEVPRVAGDAASSGPRAPVLMVQTGFARAPALGGIDWAAGALADHLTSFGGVFEPDNGQTTALAWLDSGATASYGTVSEPCNHLQKFPHPQWLLLHYLQGSTALEAYWKSVAWPRQGVFVGEPLAAPFARRSASP